MRLKCELPKNGHEHWAITYFLIYQGELFHVCGRFLEWRVLFTSMRRLENDIFGIPWARIYREPFIFGRLFIMLCYREFVLYTFWKLLYLSKITFANSRVEITLTSIHKTQSLQQYWARLLICLQICWWRIGNEIVSSKSAWVVYYSMWICR